MENKLEHFRTYLQTRMNGELPGLEAHKLMIPLSRKLARERLNPRPDAQESSVFIILHMKKSELHVIMIKRPKYEGVHSGQIAFPGGRKEDYDGSHLETAIRETDEEIGINLKKLEGVKIHGQLSYLYIPPSNFKVYPFVATCSTLPELFPDPEEVDFILHFPFKAFLDENSLGVEEFSSKNATVKAPCYYVDGQIVWGASAMMLSELATLCKDWYATD